MLSEVASPGFVIKQKSNFSLNNTIKARLLAEICELRSYSYQPYAQIVTHASQLLACCVDDSCSQLIPVAEQLIEASPTLPVHMEALLSVVAALLPLDGKLADTLATFIDSTRPESRWSLRAETVLAARRFFKRVPNCDMSKPVLW